jgi:hypothetical protein
MGLLKLLMLALATTATASNFFSNAPAAALSTKNTTTYTTELTKALTSESIQPSFIVTSFPGASDSGIMSIVAMSPMAVPFNSTAMVPLPLSTTLVPINTTIPTTDAVAATSYAASPTSNLSTVIVTATATPSGPSVSASASGSAKPSTVPGNGGGKVKVGVTITLAALMTAVLGA